MAGEKLGNRRLHETGGGHFTLNGQDFGAPDEIGVDVNQELTFFRGPWYYRLLHS
jgi:hypothetical protein